MSGQRLLGPAVCKSCPAAVFWAMTVNDKPMLVDAEPVKGGNLRLEQRDGDRLPLVHKVKPELAFGATLYVSHFTSCPDADAHRKRGKAKP